MSTSDGDGPPPDPDGRPAGASDRGAYLYLADRLAALRREHEQLADQVTGVAAASSEILPRLDDLEHAIERVGAVLEAGGRGGHGGAEPDDVTPATRWSQLDRDGREAAWNVLGDWVAEVLNGEYRLSRLQLPDCWPVHPRAVRELAWLRTLHVATRRSAVPAEIVGEWHTRWLPAALYNIATAIDRLECAPGRHRVTDAECRQHHRQLDEAAEGELGAPVLTTERGVDRPRYFPHQMPPRRGQQEDLDPRASSRSRNEPPPSLDERTPSPPSSPEDWWNYFLDARMAEIGSFGEPGNEESS